MATDYNNIDDLLSQYALHVAPKLLGARLSHATEEGNVTVRLTEVEAYAGDGVDPGSHAYRGPTRRNKMMYGPPGSLHTYFIYGMHVCANIVCSPAGTPSAVLLRAGEVIEGQDLARARRGPQTSSRDLARGPARLAISLGIELDQAGQDLRLPPFRLELAPPLVSTSVGVGPRTGLSGIAGTEEFPWRFWIKGDPTVSPYKKATPRIRSREQPNASRKLSSS